MREYDDAANLRDDDDEAAADIGRAAGGSASPMAAIVGKTASDGVYPATARVFYRIDVHAATGTEAEGSPGTLTPDGGYLFAWNYGDGVPPVGTEVIVTRVPNRWVFKFDS